MRWLLNALSTSVGRKVVLAITGLLLCGFLVAHLAGNLLLYVPDGGHSYNEYAHALHKQVVLLAIAEVGLFGLFIAHIVIALQVSAENRAARKVNYAVTRSKQEGRYAMEGYRPDTWMLVTGIIVLGFILLHLMDFKFELRGDAFYKTEAGSKLSPFDKAKALLSTSNLITIVGYALGSFALLAHLAHGFQSAFQTLGINHPKYTPLIKLVGLLFAVSIGVGFASFPILWGPTQGGSPKLDSSQKVSALPTSDLTPTNQDPRRPMPPKWPKQQSSAGAFAGQSDEAQSVPTPPSGTLEGVDDPSSLRPTSFEQQLERRIQKVPRELRPSQTPLQKPIEDK